MLHKLAQVPATPEDHRGRVAECYGRGKEVSLNAESCMKRVQRRGRRVCEKSECCLFVELREELWNRNDEPDGNPRDRNTAVAGADLGGRVEEFAFLTAGLSVEA